MARTSIWKSIADTLTAEIAKGQYAPGSKLPTEANLALRFGVNRHTVRHALAAMAEDGLTFSRRGAGVFVAQEHTLYPIGRRVRFHQNIAAAGRAAGKETLLMESRLAAPDEREALALSDPSEVHVYEGLSLADAQPLALFRSVFPAARFPNILKDLCDTSSVTEALKCGGVEDYTRETTQLTAKLATTTQALHLQITEGSPILRSVAINVDANSAPVEFGHTWFAGDRVTLTVNDL